MQVEGDRLQVTGCGLLGAKGSKTSHSNFPITFHFSTSPLLYFHGYDRSVSIHAALTHITHYRYDRLVTLSPQLVRLRPAPHCRTPIVSYTMQVEPVGHFVHWQQDPQSNYLARLDFPEKVRELKITVNLVAELAVYNPF